MSRGISIVVPTYNRAQMLGTTLASLARLNVPDGIEAEVLVIDNNCTDETAHVVAAFAASAPFRVRHIVESEQGQSVSRNRGFREAVFEHVVDFDDDVEVYVDWIPGYFDAVDRLGADCVIGPVYPVFETTIPPYVTQDILGLISSPYSRKGGLPKVLPPDIAHEVPGCNFGVRREVALAVGAFDNLWGRNCASRVMISQDDFDFGRRLVAAGRRVVYQPRCAIHHRLSGEKLNRPYLRRRWYGEGATRREVDARAGLVLTALQRVRYAAGALRFGGRALRHACAGRSDLAFQCELDARKAIGYLLHRPHTMTASGDHPS